MKKIFLDCGTHYGQGLNQFINMYNIDKSWDIYTFEANPTTYQHFLNKQKTLLNNLKINHYNLAIFNKNSSITIHHETPPNGDDSGMGSSIISLDQWNPWGDTLRNNFVSQSVVESIDFAEFIKNNCRQDDFLVIKLDIEGAEYDVLESLIEKKIIHYINDLYIEFHARFFTNTNEIINRETKIKNIINQVAPQTRLIEWH